VSSARNVIEGRVDRINELAGRAWVRVAGRPSVTAEITLGSLAALRLEVGSPVWAAFKAVEVRVLVG
jgi:molybdopterin-binding protein